MAREGFDMDSGNDGREEGRRTGPEGVTVRELSEADYPALIPLWNDELCNRNVNAENVAHHYARVKGDERYRTFVAVKGGEVVGFISSSLTYAVGFEGAFMQVIGVAVKSGEQGRGVGTLLFERMESCAEGLGCYSIGMNSGEKRVNAHAFYQKLGFYTDSLCFTKML